MNKHHTKDKGDIGVLKAAADLASQGFLVLNPLTEHAPFDLVTYKDETFLRVQVKYCTLKESVVIKADLRSVWSDKNGRHTSCDTSEIDVVGIYYPDTDECYYIKPEGKKTILLRFEDSKNGQKIGVRYAKEYRTMPG